MIKVAGSIPGRRAFGCSLGQFVHTHVRLSSSSINLVTSASWEGNCTSGVALAMCHGQEWYFHLRAHGLGKRDEY